VAPAHSVQPTNTHPSPLEQPHFDGAGLFLWGGISSLRPSFVGQVAIVGQAFQLGLVPFTDCRSCAQSPRRRKVEQAARLAMPASPWSKPPGLPCRRSRRQRNTTPGCTRVPSANRRQDWRRGPQDCALHLNPPPPQVEQAARLAMPAVTPAEPHNPERYGSPNAMPPARLRAPLQPAAPRRCRPACPPPLFLSPCPPWSVFLRVLRVLCTTSP